MDDRSNALDGQLLGDVEKEPGHDEPFGRLGVDASGLQVVTLVLVDRTNSRAVAAAHVVLFDVEVGNRVSMGSFVEDQVVVGLHGIRSNRPAVDPDQPAVHRVGMVGHRSLEQQVARRARR